MAASNFAPALALVLPFEGDKFTNDPRDPGGPTKLGVTLRTLSSWLGRACTIADVKALTTTTVSPLYRQHVWDAIHGDALPSGADLMCFDAAINQGVSAVTKMLQRAAYVTADGHLGPVTLKAISAAKPLDLITRLQAERAAAYRACSDWPTYGVGWMRRLDSVTATAKGWAA